KEQIESLSDQEINEIIVSDLYVNAYEDQDRFNVRYVSSKNDYAVGIEIALYTCPNCGRIGTIKSKEHRFFCDCGLDMIYTKNGWITATNGDDSKFNTILEWDRWQLGELSKKLQQSKDRNLEIFHDSQQTLYMFESEGHRLEVISGTLALYRDRLEFADSDRVVVFSFSDIDNIEITGRMTITFVTKDKTCYEVRSETLRSAKKYRDSFRIIKGMSA
ncbi:MAG: hypothetical protein FWG21_02845, partial [Oscillospiraceae bacterium]|nr:hypothetical protein [Oscillospiraceae bacterium]